MTPTGDVSARLTVDLVENDYKGEVEKKLREIGQKRQIPGFRPGKTPLATLQRMFGQHVASDVINEMVYMAVINYLMDNDVNVLGQPLPVESVQLDLKNKKDYTFEYDLALSPEINVTVDKDLHLPWYDIKITDEMVDEQDKAMRKRFGSQVPGEEVEPDAVVKGALQQLNADGTVNTNEGAIQVVNGVVYPALFHDKDQTALFMGKKVGDKVRFNPAKTCSGNPAELSSMLHIDKAIAADVDSDFEMAISEIIVVRPAELGEEYYENTFGKEVTNEEEYRKAVAGIIARDLKSNSEELFERDTRDILLAKAGEIKLADDLLKRWLLESREGFTKEEIDGQYETQLPGIAWELVSGKIERDANIEITEDDLMGFARGLAGHQFAQYGMYNLAPDVIDDYARRMLDDKNTRRQIAERVSHIKLFEAIKQRATIDVKTVTLDEFRELAAKETSAPEA